MDNYILPNSFIFYTDGSMITNPGPGGGAFWSPNFIVSVKMIPIMHDTTINYAELSALKLVFESVYNIYNKYPSCPKMNITIFTDSLFCLNLMSVSGYAVFNYYYKLMNEIFNIINKLENEYNIKTKIIKVKNHTGIEGNEIVDKIAKKAELKFVTTKNMMKLNYIQN